ncbi:MAG: ABC transporter ATP-binding protein [Proteobacteria bacterium]|nr:ABC transporter ATP-binding protein [Pseudomonadota bacterium]MBU4469075.1 ABC transporter ATP-binding protein [Pseudomonadota bacterium]MCG2751047.1 ABC transporter ATP-binding protein [Desulfobacteraceae bacterium]
MTALNSDAITVNHLVKRFGTFLAVNDISFSVEKGEIFGFLGANGSGKSTTIRMLCGILTPTSGTGQVAGFDIVTEPEKIKQSIGYMSQKFSLYMDLTPAENIRFYLGVYNIPENLWEERTRWILDLTRLEEYKNRAASELAPGWRQRLALGCALLHKPKLLFLDEPTSGVDPLTRRHFWTFIGSLAESGITVFVTTHYMEEAMHCKRVALINEGRIVALGSPAELIRKAFPENDKADLNDLFIHLMSRSSP